MVFDRYHTFPWKSVLLLLRSAGPTLIEFCTYYCLPHLSKPCYLPSAASNEWFSYSYAEIKLLKVVLGFLCVRACVCERERGGEREGGEWGEERQTLNRIM
jgi:hypothetical protein